MPHRFREFVGETRATCASFVMVAMAMAVLCPTVHADPRGEITLRWTAPGSPGETALAYELRAADVAPGADTLAWWNAASSIPGLPDPAIAGTVQTFPVQGLAPGHTVWFALRSRNAEGIWSTVAHIHSWTAPGGPWLDAVAPASTQAGPVSLALGGLGLAAVSAVGFRTSSGDMAWGTIAGVSGDTVLAVTADLTGAAPGQAAVVATTGTATDTLAGWFTILTPAAIPDTTGPAPVLDLAVVTQGQHTLALTFTAPADTQGTVKTYDLRYVPGATFDPAQWNSASGVPTEAPLSPGSAETLTVNGLGPGQTYTFRVRSTDDSGNPSAPGNPATGTTLAPPDITGPAPVTDLAVTGAGESWITLGFTAPADSQGTVNAYDLRYVPGTSFDPAQWNGATVALTEAPLPPGSVESITVTGLDPGTTYTFRLRSADNSGNPSVPGNPATGTTPAAPDTTGPAAVTDLAASGATQHTLTLTFTAPADQEGTLTTYDLRMTTGTTFPDSAWDSATGVPTGTPRVPGAAETVMVSGLDPGADHAFRIRSVDDSGNWSALGNTASGRTLNLTDTTAPARITDLAAAVADTYVVVLSWTAPGDDGTTGQASLYDVRWRADTLSAATWSQAARIAGVPAPHVPGYLEILQITGLPADQDLALAVRTLDEAGNTSPISNVVTARIVTPQPPDTQPPAPIEGLRADSDSSRVNLAWDAGVEPDLAYYRLYRGRGSSGTAGMLLYRNHLDLPEVTDDQVIPGRDYCYAVTAVDVTGNESARSGPLTVRVPFRRFTEPLPPFLTVSDPYPNPTRGGLSLDYETPDALQATVEVYDVRGRRIRTLAADAAGPGRHQVHWDGLDASGRRVARGMYFVRFKTGSDAWTRKIQVLP